VLPGRAADHSSPSSASTLWHPLVHTGPVTGSLYLYLMHTHTHTYIYIYIGGCTGCAGCSQAHPLMPEEQQLVFCGSYFEFEFVYVFWQIKTVSTMIEYSVNFPLINKK